MAAGTGRKQVAASSRSGGVGGASAFSRCRPRRPCELGRARVALAFELQSLRTPRLAGPRGAALAWRNTRRPCARSTHGQFRICTDCRNDYVTTRSRHSTTRTCSLTDRRGIGGSVSTATLGVQHSSSRGTGICRSPYAGDGGSILVMSTVVATLPTPPGYHLLFAPDRTGGSTRDARARARARRRRPRDRASTTRRSPFFPLSTINSVEVDHVDTTNPSLPHRSPRREHPMSRRSLTPRRPLSRATQL